MDEWRSGKASLAQTDQSRAEPDAPHEDEIRQQLYRILHSAAFRDSLRLTRFLAFVVEATLAGNAERIKAYTIAVEALGRSTDFDPQADPIVRVEAGRLRGALARYYSGAGRNDPLVMDLPRGAYVPTFGRRSAETAPPPLAAGRFAAQGDESDHVTEMLGQGRQFNQVVTVFQELTAIHRQLAVMTAQIESTQQALINSRVLSPVGDRDCLACRPAALLLPTAPSSQPDAPRTADGRQEQRTQQTQSALAAWPRRSRPGGHRRDAADDADDPSSLRALRLRGR